MLRLKSSLILIFAIIYNVTCSSNIPETVPDERKTIIGNTENWTIIDVVNEFNEPVHNRAMSPAALPVRRMSGVYNRVVSMAFVECLNGQIEFGFGFTASPNLTGGDTVDGGGVYRVPFRVSEHHSEIEFSHARGPSFYTVTRGERSSKKSKKPRPYHYHCRGMESRGMWDLYTT